MWHRFSCVLTAFIVLLALASSVKAQGSETRITVKLWIDAVMVSPQKLAGNAVQTFTILLSGANTVNETVVGGGKFVLTNSRVTALGGTDDGKVRYKVLNANTIQRTARVYNHISTVTIRVNGTTCAASYGARPVSGTGPMQSWSQNLGQVASYSSLTLSRSECTVQ